MARTAPTEKSKIAQPPAPAGQSAPEAAPAQTPSIAELMGQVAPEDRPQLLADLRARLQELEDEQTRIPERRETARRAAREAANPKEIERHIATADELGRRERVLAIQIHRAKRELLESEIADLRLSSVEMGLQVAEAQRKFEDADALMHNAGAAFELASRERLKLADQVRGFGLKAQEKERELQLLNSTQPEI